MRLETRESVANSVRPRVQEMVEDRFLTVKSRVLAVSDVGKDIGHSPSWVKRLLARSESLVVAGHDLINIANAYARLCDRRDARQETERLRTEAMRADAEALRASVDTGKRRAPITRSGLRLRRAIALPPAATRPHRFAAAAAQLECPALGRV